MGLVRSRITGHTERLVSAILVGVTITEEPRSRRGGSGLTTAFVLIWVVLALGVPALMFAGAMATFSIAGSGVSAAEAATSRAFYTTGFIVAVGLPALGLGLAVWGRRKPSGIVFGSVLLLVVCGSLAPTSRAPGKPHSILQNVFPGLVEPYTPPPDPPAGCFGDSPADEGNPACRGG